MDTVCATEPDTLTPAMEGLLVSALTWSSPGGRTLGPEQQLDRCWGAVRIRACVSPFLKDLGHSPLETSLTWPLITGTCQYTACE